MSLGNRYSTKWQSPNFEDRKDGIEPSIILLHYTGMPTAELALQRLCDPDSKVSAHYVVDEDGTVYRLVEEGKRAWHAGQSEWQGETDINSHSIGIELVNPGHEHGYRPFPEIQIEALIGLCRDICERHAIKWVLGHEHVAPDRKQDPGELFPWDRIEKEGFGKLAKQ